jgi:hypothetical protein
MNFNEKIKEMNKIMFNIISTKEITYIKDLDKRININKYGKFYYYKIFDFSNSSIKGLLIFIKPLFYLFLLKIKF